MEMVFIIIQQVVNSKENGFKIKKTGMELSNTLIMIDTKDIGQMDKDLVKELINILMEISIEVNGWMILNMDMVSFKWQPVTNIKEVGWLEKKTDLVILLFIFKVIIHLPTEMFTRGNFKMVTDKEKENIAGRMEAIIKDNGYAIKWMEQVFTLILRSN
jgi:hypothetical protein